MRRPDRTARRRLAQRGGGGDQERERPRQRRAGETEHARQPRRRRRLSPRARTADRSPSGGAPARDPLRRRGDRRRRQTGRDGHAPRAGLVHRLDRDTSGLLVIAKTAKALATLGKAMQKRYIVREYRGIVVG